MKIPFIVEPEYKHSIWADRTLNGLRKEAALKKYELFEIELDPDGRIQACQEDVGSCRMVIVIGTTYSWVPKTVLALKDQGLLSILIHFDPPEGFRPRATVHVDYTQAMQVLTRYLHACGKHSIALYGLNPNSSTDILKQTYMESIGEGGAVFYNHASLSECYTAFRKRLPEFDAVICANDIAAVSLMTHLQSDGIRIPEDLFLTSFGQSVLAVRTNPGITTVSLDHFETGTQAVRLFSWLTRQEDMSCVSVRVRARLTVRGSTAMMPEPEEADDLSFTLPPHGNVNFYSDREAETFMHIEQLLMRSDDMDYRIMHGLIKGLKPEVLEEQLYLSDSALRYRMKKLSESAGCESRTDFLAFLKEWEAFL